MQVQLREAGLREESAQALGGVVVDRAIVDHLVAQLPDRPFRPGPAREAGHSGARTELAHPANVPLRISDVVEVTEGEHDVERSRDRRLQEVALDELDLVGEPRKPFAREVEHRVRQVHVHVP